jgi:hypothetical protein
MLLPRLDYSAFVISNINISPFTTPTVVWSDTASLRCMERPYRDGVSAAGERGKYRGKG